MTGQAGAYDPNYGTYSAQYPAPAPNYGAPNGAYAAPAPGPYGAPAPGAYGPPAYAPGYAAGVYGAPPACAPASVWIDGYYNATGFFVNGYCAVLPFGDAYWVAPYWFGGRFFAGYWAHGGYLGHAPGWGFRGGYAAPRFNGGARFAAPAPRGGFSGGFHSAPAFHGAAPSFRSAAPSIHAAPSFHGPAAGFHSAAPSSHAAPSFRGSTGGGFHGGGHAGGGHGGHR